MMERSEIESRFLNYSKEEGEIEGIIFGETEFKTITEAKGVVGKLKRTMEFMYVEKRK